MHSSILKKEKKSLEFEQVDIAEKLRAEKNVLGKSLKCVSGARNTITSLMRTLLLAVWMCMNWNRLLRIRFMASYNPIQHTTASIRVYGEYCSTSASFGLSLILCIFFVCFIATSIQSALNLGLALFTSLCWISWVPVIWDCFSSKDIVMSLQIIYISQLSAYFCLCYWHRFNALSIYFWPHHVFSTLTQIVCYSVDGGFFSLSWNHSFAVRGIICVAVSWHSWLHNTVWWRALLQRNRNEAAE